MIERDGGPAFPTLREDRSEDLRWVDDGMSLRDWFAGQALSGYLASTAGMGVHTDGIRRAFWATVAESAYEVADAMIRAREGGTP